MNVQRRDFLLLVTLAAAVATPARAQTVTPAAPPATQSAASIPDFSGIWAHLTLPGFEPPASGLGPVRIKSRLPNGAANFQQAAGDYTDPNLKAQAAEVVKKYGEIELSGMPNPNPANQCWPGGVPYVFWNIGMQMLQQPHQIAILYSNDHEVRRVRINQPHPAQVTPSWYGDSIGRYEGDTLVVDTVGIKVGPFAMVDFYGTPHTEALHVVERYRLVDYEVAKDAEERGARENFRVRSGTGFAPNLDYKGKGLQLQFTVEDEGVFTMPWSATITYRRPLGEWPEFVCAENTQWYPGKKSAVPNADKPDF